MRHVEEISEGKIMSLEAEFMESDIDEFEDYVSEQNASRTSIAES